MDADSFLLALCVWREARGEPQLGWIAVAWVIKNRMTMRKQTLYKVVTARLQFSSMTAPKDPELSLWPDEHDATWISIQAEATGVMHGIIPDPTGGASSYYANYIAFPPSWNLSLLQQTAKIGKHIFFKELVA